MASPISTTSILSSPYARQSLEMQYMNGACAISIPLPLKGNEEQRVFSLSLDSTVKDVAAQIKSEDSSIQEIVLQTRKGDPYLSSDSLHSVLSDDFKLAINDKVYSVRAPVFIGDAYTSIMDSGDLDVRAVTQKSAVIALRHTLSTLHKWKISYSEFSLMCEEHGIAKTQAAEVLNAFHHAGTVFYFGQSGDEDLEHSIFLQPRSILDSYLKSIGLTPVSTQLFMKERDRLRAFIDEREPEYKALKGLEKELEKTAVRAANGTSAAMTTTLVGGFGLYFYLSFIHFSWDIMEPVTYFTGFGVSIIGYLWWSITNQEYEYENIYDYVYQSRLKKLIEKRGMDAARLAEVEAAVLTTKKRVGQLEEVLRKPTALQARYLHLLELDAGRILGQQQKMAAELAEEKLEK